VLCLLEIAGVSDPENDHGSGIRPPEGGDLLARDRCRVIGLNQNYTSQFGTGYHIQIEDRGPVFDDATEQWVRRLNTIVYANYGESTARIVHGRDEDFRDLRTAEHNRFIEARIEETAGEVKDRLERREEGHAARIKSLLLHYHRSRDEAVKAEFDEANRLYPAVFARAWQELKAERAEAEVETAAENAAEPPLPEIEETVYPLDPAKRDLVLYIERVREDLERCLHDLKAGGGADDILLATTAKILHRVHESLTQQAESDSDFAARRLEMTKKSLVTIYRQVRDRLNRQAGTKE
jgi:hypothetical protein